MSREEYSEGAADPLTASPLGGIILGIVLATYMARSNDRAAC